ncbi:MAG: hypothetical protein ACKOA1_12930, partial [Bacteroidota bacterium]
MDKRILLFRFTASLLFAASFFKASAQFDVSTYSFTTATGTVLETVTSPTGTLLSSGQEDAASAVTNIGFTFNFAGVDYTQFSVSSNGLMGLGSTAILT